MLSYVVAVALVALLTLAELRAGGTLTRDRFLNVQLWIFRASISLWVVPLVALTMPWSLIDASTLPWLIGFATYLLAMDLGEYLFHRAQHAIPWLWSMHAVHHSDPDMNATTTERHFWGEVFLKIATIYPAVILFVLPTSSMIVAYGVLSLWNFFAHAAVPISFGRWSWALNSPAYHRRHHSNLPEHYNSNYAALLPIFDVIFGTYNRPTGFPPTGLDRKPSNLVEAVIWPWMKS